ncbi:hypothetical protein BJAS_P4720 [Bathymodiolus japonicus methanotrophic gill symbiont]|uniref:antiviral reverse transcriptase Drt3b n=1 Tax=Bathymodiolus japonicus methanotrophic gill symbiont TaxID=113269 RepID=UPI001B3FCB9B|nr:antiviral reverse transcriptase Drt3b [Bathymodiolus japonicus methanotrophic gill symbiont]GFO73728.1 hypothetical protein BJAS_P4720 [Bathymodiolus japonicus methanotrophic gill symbiont]
MSEVININDQDKHRTLLTDVLPYELPLWYTNYSMYKAFKDKDREGIYLNTLDPNFSKSADSLIPLNYTVSRGGNKFRDLYIIHPIAQLKVCDFYHKFYDLIEYYCGKSNQSLRYPVKKTTKFYGKTSAAKNDSDGVETLNDDRVTSSSYFKYKRYSFLYRFFESYDYHKLEKRFSHMMQNDIAKCFPSIYTHSIGWATKTKRLSKKRTKGSFDRAFDSLMQDINYRETHGIIIGPEVCRIFAEVILQQIDLDLIAKLKKCAKFGNDGLVIGKDYDFRRYVDDYFIFYRDDGVCKTVLSALEKCLLDYKLYLNDTKTTYTKRPFSTEISLSKNAIRSNVDSLYRSRYKEDSTIVLLQQPDWKANKSISSIKMALAAYDVQYYSISNYLFSAIEKGMKAYLKKVSDLDKVTIEHVNWLLVDLDVLFFIHAMDIRIRTTDRLARMIDKLLDSTNKWSESFRDLIHKKVFDMVYQSISIITNSLQGIVGLETLNLLVILTMLPSDFRLGVDKLKGYYKSIRESSDTQDFYFSWVTFMLYTKNEEPYKIFCNELINDARIFILGHLDGFRSTEYFLLFFDFMACKYISENIRRELGIEVKELTTDRFNCNKLNANLSKIMDNDFVVSWRDDKYLQNSLEKREFIFSYD